MKILHVSLLNHYVQNKTFKFIKIFNNSNDHYVKWYYFKLKYLVNENKNSITSFNVISVHN
jgi:hypothetical protein